MVHKMISTTLIAFSILTFSVGFAKDKETAPAPKEKMEMQGMGADLTQKDKMHDEKMHCMGMPDSLDALLKTVQEARKSNDKAKMETALLQTEKQLALMKTERMECMKMMGKMHGQMGEEGMENCEKHHPK